MNKPDTLQTYARLGGFMYLFILALYIGGSLMMGSYQVKGDFTQTAANIAASEGLYRTSLSLQLLSSVATILLAGSFYVLLKPIDRNLALFALLWRLGEAVMGGMSSVFRFVGLSVYNGEVSGLDAQGQQALVGLATSAVGATFPISVIFFSFGSIVFFYLLYRSRFIPRSLAIFSLGASVLASIMGFVELIAPDRAAAVGYLWAPIFIAEVATGVWLLARGANLQWWATRDESPPAGSNSLGAS